MDRRVFLKTGLLGAGTVAVTAALPSFETNAAEKVNSPLKASDLIKEPPRRIPVVDKADVVVVGGGPAGFAAARHGADTILLERQYFLGGLFTGCGVTPVINMFAPQPNGGREQAIFGICQELCDRLGNAGMLNAEGIRPKSECSAGVETPVNGVKTRHTVGEREQDGLDIYNLTGIQMKLRRQMWEDTERLRRSPGCGDLFQMDSPSVVVVRITRVLNSVSNVMAEDAAAGKVYDDVIGIAGGDSTLTVSGGRHLPAKRPLWQIPYSSLVPKTVRSLLVGGRCFGFERPLTFDAREIGVCFLTGQASGTAVALCADRRCSSRELDIKDLQRQLKGDNVKFS